MADLPGPDWLASAPPVAQDEWRAAFPDAEQIIADGHGRYGKPGEVRVAKVPETDVFVLYSIHEDDHTVQILMIRTYRGKAAN